MEYLEDWEIQAVEQAGFKTWQKITCPVCEGKGTVPFMVPTWGPMRGCMPQRFYKGEPYYLQVACVICNQRGMVRIDKLLSLFPHHFGLQDIIDFLEK